MPLTLQDGGRAPTLLARPVSFLRRTSSWSSSIAIPSPHGERAHARVPLRCASSQKRLVGVALGSVVNYESEVQKSPDRANIACRLSRAIPCCEGSQPLTMVSPDSNAEVARKARTKSRQALLSAVAGRWAVARRSRLGRGSDDSRGELCAESRPTSARPARSRSLVPRSAPPLGY